MALEADRREPPGVADRTVLIATVGFLLFVAAGLGLLGLYYRHVLNAVPVPKPVATFPAPRLQVDPRADLTDLQRRQRERLASYDWIDRNAGIVQIPVERAMALLAARGSQAYAPLEEPPAQEPRP